MRTATNLAKALALTAMAIFLAGAARAGSVSFNNTNDPPFNALASLYITNLFAAYLSPAHGTDFGQGSNCGNGGTTGLDPNDASVYTGAGAWVGQSFKTGPAATGYKLISTSVRQVAYQTSFAWGASCRYIVRITKIGTDTNTVTVVAQETAQVGVDWSGFPTSNITGDGGRGGNYGRYLTFTFDTPVPLLPNTQYGFDIGIDSPSGTYWEMDGRRYIPGTTTPYDGYTNGTAYTDFNGSLTVISNVPGDRAFIVALNPATTVTPPRFTSEYAKDGRPRTTNQPLSGTWYTGNTAIFRAKAAGDTNLVYQWQRFGTNISDGTKYSGTLTDTLSVSNVAAGDSGSAFTLVVTNAAGAITSSPPAILTTAAPPTAGTYAYSVYASKPIAHYRLNDVVNPATNPPTFDYIGGGVGQWETNAVRTNGPIGSAFIGFENSGGITNRAVQVTTNTANINYSWATLAPLHLKTNSASFAAWIYPNGPPGVQGGKYSGFFFTRAGSSECGMCVGDSSTAINGVGQLAYTWNNGVGDDRSWPSGFTVPANQWVFIALVVTPTNGTVYFAANGGALQSAVHSVPHATETWDGPWTAGYDPRWAGPMGAQYTFNGIVDELAAWDRSLSFTEMTNIYAAAFTSSNGTPPLVITCSTNKTVQCGSAWSFDAPSASGGCGTATNISVTGTITNGVCPQVITRTWLATDGCSGSESCSQIVTVVDTTPPIITCATNKTVQCGSAWSFDAPSASDACAGTNVTIIVTGSTTNGSACSLAITRTWQATDGCSNAALCSQTVTVLDTTPPVITCATNKTVQCGSAWSFDAPSASDACAGTNVTIIITGTTTNGSACSLAITRTWQATDPCTNSNTCSQTVTVVSPDCAPVQIADVSYAGTTLTMSFQSLSCVVYDCQYTDELIGGSSWTTFQTVTGTGNSISVQDTVATSNQRFYRVVCRCH